MIFAALASAVLADIRPVARGADAEQVQLRPLARVDVATLRPSARTVVEAAPALTMISISTMSAPPIRTAAAIADLPLLGAKATREIIPFLPPLLPLREPEMVTLTADVRPVLRPYRPLPAAISVDPFAPNVLGPRGEGLVAVQFSAAAAATAYRPPERPEGITLAAMALQEERRRGSVCGDLALQGVNKGNVPGRGRCGIENAVEIRSVAGVRLSNPAVIDCTTAIALRRWVENSAIPQFRGVGGGLAEIQMMGAYSCRTRNNVAGARLSEHSFGRAVDIGGFTMRDGSRVSVLRGWNSEYGQQLRAMHRAACGPFGTVLGPNANAAHRDHFHFDTARYRSGSYCR